MCGYLIPHHHYLVYCCYGLSSVSYFTYLIKLCVKEKENIPPAVLAVFPSSKNYHWKKMRELVAQSNFLVSLVCLIYLSHSKSGVTLKYTCMHQTGRKAHKKTLWFWGAVSLSFLKILIQIKKQSIWQVMKILLFLAVAYDCFSLWLSPWCLDIV